MYVCVCISITLETMHVNLRAIHKFKGRMIYLYDHIPAESWRINIYLHFFFAVRLRNSFIFISSWDLLASLIMPSLVSWYCNYKQSRTPIELAGDNSYHHYEIIFLRCPLYKANDQVPCKLRYKKQMSIEQNSRFVQKMSSIKEKDNFQRNLLKN